MDEGGSDRPRASMIALARTPELLFLILEYLPSSSVLSLLQTCKSLYPVCYRHLWTTIPFLQHEHFAIIDGYKTVAQILATLIKEKGVDALGFNYTTTLELGHGIFGLLSADSVEIIPILTNLIDTNYLGLQHVNVYLSQFDKGLPLTDNEKALLLSLKRYSESKSPRDLAIRLRTDIVRDIHQLFNVELITELSLVLQQPDSSGRHRSTLLDRQIGRFSCWSTPQDDMESHIIELANMLFRLRNLKRFEWGEFTDVYDPSKISKPSTSFAHLQDKFTDMTTLRELTVHTPFFHQSFFLTPPNCLRKLVILGPMPNKWWQQFSECPMPSVEVLEVHGMVWLSQSSNSNHRAGPPHPIGHVAICGLKEAQLIGSSALPSDLALCLLQSNKRLSRKSQRGLAEYGAQALVSAHENSLKYRLYDSADALDNKYTSKFIENPDTDYLQEYVREFEEKLLTCATNPSLSRTWTEPNERARALSRAAEFRLVRTLKGCIEHVEHLYAEKFVEGLRDASEEDFRRECLELFTQSPKYHEHGNLRRGRRNAQELGELCRREMKRRLHDKGHEARERAIEMIINEDSQHSELITEFVKDALEGFQDSMLNRTTSIF